MMRALEVIFLYYIHFYITNNWCCIIEEDTREKGKLYKPQSRLSSSQENLSSAERAQEYARLLANDRKPERLGRKRTKDKSNLESFKEELRQ